MDTEKQIITNICLAFAEALKRSNAYLFVFPKNSSQYLKKRYSKELICGQRPAKILFCQRIRGITVS